MGAFIRLGDLQTYLSVAPGFAWAGDIGGEQARPAEVQEPAQQRRSCSSLPVVPQWCCVDHLLYRPMKRLRDPASFSPRDVCAARHDRALLATPLVADDIGVNAAEPLPVPPRHHHAGTGA